MTFEQCRHNWLMRRDNWIPLPDPDRIVKWEGGGDKGEIDISSAHKVTGQKPASHFLWSMLVIPNLQMCEGLGKGPRIKSGTGFCFLSISHTPSSPAERRDCQEKTKLGLVIKTGDGMFVLGFACEIWRWLLTLSCRWDAMGFSGFKNTQQICDIL